MAVRRSRARDVAVCGLQMWAYLAAYKTPHDDEAAQARRVHVDYPIGVDRVLGFGELPTCACSARSRASGPTTAAELARARPGARLGPLDVVRGAARRARCTSWSASPERFPRAAVMTYAVFDIGASVYWLAPDRAAVVRGLGGADASDARRRRTCGG